MGKDKRDKKKKRERNQTNQSGIRSQSERALCEGSSFRYKHCQARCAVHGTGKKRVQVRFFLVALEMEEGEETG